MKNNDLIFNHLLENKFEFDELGRVVISDPTILSEINGAFGASDALRSTGSNGNCANGSCS